MTTECVHCDVLTETVEAAHERALAALTAASAGRFDAVVWLAAHLAATEHVLHPELHRHLPGAAAPLHDLRRTDSELQRALRWLEQVLAGDALTAGADLAAVRGQVITLLAAHAAAEHALVVDLARSIGADATGRLVERYRRAVATGPTRPHPHAPTGRFAPLGFALERWRDRALDVMDARSVPLPRLARRRRTPGAWGHYLLGTMRPPQD